MLRRRQAEAPWIFQSLKDVRLLLVISIRHLRDSTDRPSIRIKAVIEANRIEDVSENARESQQLDA